MAKFKRGKLSFDKNGNKRSVKKMHTRLWRRKLKQRGTALVPKKVSIG